MGRSVLHISQRPSRLLSECPAPEGRPRLAQRFSAGKSGRKDSSPGGTTEFSLTFQRCITWVEQRFSAALRACFVRRLQPPGVNTLPAKRARKARLKVQHPDPLRRNRDLHHAGHHRPYLLHPRLALLWTEVTFGRRRVFRHDSLDCLQARCPAHQQHLMRKSIVVNRQRDLRILRQRLQLGRFRWSRHHKLPSIPVEPDRNDSRRSVRRDIRQPGGNLGLQQFLRNRILQEFEVSLLDWHGFAPSLGQSGLGGINPRRVTNCKALTSKIAGNAEGRPFKPRLGTTSTALLFPPARTFFRCSTLLNGG